MCDGAANCCGLCGQDRGTAPPRRASRNMVGSGERKTDQCHECPAHGARRTRQPRRGHARDRPRRAQRRACARAGAGRAEERRARRHGQGHPPRTVGDPRRQRRGRGGGEVRRCDRRVSRPAHARRRSCRGDGRRTRGRPQAQGSGRHGHGVMAAPQRHAHRARARAARRRRRDLREPAQRDRRCRRALPQGRQRGDPARRFRKLPHRARHPCRPGRRPVGRGTAGGRDLRSCRRGSALPSA